MRFPPIKHLLPKLAAAFIAIVTGSSALLAQQQARHFEHQQAGVAKDGAVLWPLDILHQRIELNLALGSIIEGHCTITAVPRADATTTFPLQLLALTVDSVTSPLGDLAFTQTAEDLSITLAAPANTTDTIELTVHYQGDPLTDASGFGGFYTTGQYSYNLGVAFTSQPHSYGRAWFPCADNFTERSSYEFLVTTPLAWNAWCNGEKLSESQPSPTTRLVHWRINETMPAYLASVAASNYAVVHDTLPSISGTDIPVVLVARPPDTTNMKNSFIHLPEAFALFEEWFGAYRWNKVGYVLTPQGAMEHSTSIHYPVSITNGTLAYQDIMAHELGHQWFGDLVTCDRPEEMYINEGFAEYLSYLFLGAVNGQVSYTNTVRNNHLKMVHQAHRLDQGWWALDSVPQDWTYGEHSYNKGADVIHSLRGYLGDSLFKAGFTSFLDAYAFQPVNTELMRDHLTQATGVDLSDFFADWIQQPGWASFEVDSMHVNTNPLPGGYYLTDVFLQQKQRGPAQPYHNVPVTLSFMDALGNSWTYPLPVMLGGESCTVGSAPPFIPKWAFINGDDKLSLAVTGTTDTINAVGNQAYPYANFDLTFPAGTSNARLRVEHYWVAPDNDEVADAFAFIISPDRYWRVIGNIPAGTIGRAYFDGRTTVITNYDPGLMHDTLGFDFREDSLVMLYRAEPWHPWAEVPTTVNTLGPATDGYGRITIDSLWAGEYTLAWRKSAVGMAETTPPELAWTIAPNPASEQVSVSTALRLRGSMELIDSTGRIVGTDRVVHGNARFDLSNVRPGIYALRFMPADGGSEQYAGSLVVE
ncbi:MAG: hypothetical protein IPL52_12495 [Flavobacteriales bacterium]|nr:hypothetical protein [Flavobacteriales bacterium]